MAEEPEKITWTDMQVNKKRNERKKDKKKDATKHCTEVSSFVLKAKTDGMH